MRSTRDRPRAGLEREAKLSAAADFELPDVGGLMPGVIAKAQPELRLDAVYYDTSDLRLARFGVTVRHRTGEGAARWTVKLPEGAGNGSRITRREIDLPGSDGSPPAEVADLVLAFTRGRRLAPVARLLTRRQPVDLCDSDGRLLAQVVDDRVSVTRGRHAAEDFREVGAFREVEVEARADGKIGRDLLDAAVTRLVAAGAQAEPPVPKLVRALGPRAARPPDLAVPALPDWPTATDLVHRSIARSVAQILRHDAGARLGTDPEDVHQLRVATRRLRSDLRTFAPLLDGEQTAPVCADLGRLGRSIGAVRDADVLGARLTATCRALPEQDRPGADRLLRQLREQRDAARDAMLVSLRERRYQRLLETLVKWAAQPPLRAAVPADPAAPRPAAADDQVTARIARRPWKRLQRAVAALGENPPDAQLHAVRILAKRSRYAAEAVAALYGRGASRFAGRIADVQTVLGDHQDTVVAEDWLRAAAGADPDARLAAGQLIAVERVRRAQLRAQWPAAWRRASVKQLRGWMT